jgi:hypothetical protein
MAGRWHNTIVQILKELCEEGIKSGKYRKVCDGNSEPLAISYKKYTYYYQPDLYLLYPSGKIDVFEVIDTESEGEAVMDIVYSALTPRIQVISVVCSDESKLEAIKKHARIILNKFFNEDKKSYAYIFNKKYFVYVPRNAKFFKAIKKQLKKELDL